MLLPINYGDTHYTIRKIAREEYITLQEGLCYHCKAPLTGSPTKTILDKPITLSLFPTGFLNWPVHLHHDHTTGMTIGAVHSYCNAVLWEHHGE